MIAASSITPLSYPSNAPRRTLPVFVNEEESACVSRGRRKRGVLDALLGLAERGERLEGRGVKAWRALKNPLGFPTSQEPLYRRLREAIDFNDYIG